MTAIPSDYIVASRRIRWEGDSGELAPERIGGFAPFRTPFDPQALPLLTFRTGVAFAGEEGRLWDGLCGYGPETAGDKEVRAEVLSRFDSGDFDCLLARCGDSYRFRMEPQRPGLPPLRMRIVPWAGGFLAETDAADGRLRRALRFACWIACNIALIGTGTVALHASAVDCGGRGILFLGESGTGKSTQARLWCAHIPGASLLNDDSPFVGMDAGKVWAYGSPWSGKTPCYRNGKVPVAAFVRLVQAPANRIAALSGLRAFGALQPAAPPAFARDELLTDRICSLLSASLSETPLYRLECLPDREAAALLFAALRRDRRL